MRGGLQSMTLLLLMIVLVAAVLGVLGAATAQADLTRAEKQAETATQRQSCVNQAHSWLARTQEEIRAGAHQGETLCAAFTDGERQELLVELRVENGSYTITRWESGARWEEQEPDGLLRIG